MKRKLFIVILILSLGLNAGVVATVVFHHMRAKIFNGMQKENSWMKKHIKKKLGLSDEQSNALDKGREDMRTNTQAVRDSLKKKREELFTLVKNTDTYTQDIEKLIGEISSLQMEMERNIIRHSMSAKKILNPDQRQKFDKMMEKGFNKMHNSKNAPDGQPGPGCPPQGGF
jgi:Spy/CpxP family protein refolding chaperone